MDSKILEKLIEIRERLKKENKKFPKHLCGLASSEVFDELGFDIFEGGFMDNGKIKAIHYWNVTPENEIVDLTAGQFGDFPDVYVINKDSEKAKKYYCGGRKVWITPKDKIPEFY
jgi:hypothetical protein